MGVMWVLAVLTASENSPLLTMLLSGTVVFHAFFCLIGYCIINKRVRENLNRSFLRCIGRKVPLLDSSQAVSVSSQNATSNPRSPGGYLGGGNFESTRKNMGISASSTTSKSTTKRVQVRIAVMAVALAVECDTHLRRHRIITATQHRICAATVAAVSVASETIDTGDAREKIPIQVRKRMAEVWNWRRVIPATTMNRESIVIARP